MVGDQNELLAARIAGSKDRFVGDQIDMSIEHFPPRFELLEIKMNLCRHGFAKGQGPKTELLAIKMNF